MTHSDVMVIHDASYTFRFTASDSFGASSAVVVVHVHSPPVPGYIEASPLSGTAGSTQFSLRARNWAAQDGAIPLRCDNWLESEGFG